MGGLGKIEDHEPGLMEKMMTGEGTFEQGSGKKRFPFKYYKILFQTVGVEEEKLFVADWSPTWQLTHDVALKSFAQVVSEGSVEKLFDLLEIDRSGSTRSRLRASGLEVGHMVAWYLYAASQQGLSKPPIHLAIARILKSELPPKKFMALANLSWELWRCYASLLILHPAVRDPFRQAPMFEDWIGVYGRFRPASLPFGVGEELTDVTQLRLEKVVEPAFAQSTAVASRQTDENNGVVDMNEKQKMWDFALKQLELAMTKSTFNAWLKESVLLDTSCGENSGECHAWVVGVKNQKAVEWLSNRLNEKVIEPMVSAIHGQPTTVSFRTF
ncbi:MAG: hypothetical protein DHS20C20_17910 [Ardenticatenaceae bacterium]|nr:MAG: hypothetical protein DHS20C20_17910 [Ardenticatenaceae bacterium]